MPKFESFASLSSFLVSVAIAGMGGGIDQRLEIAAATGLDEGVPSEGGFMAMPDALAADVWEAAWQTGQILSRCTPQPVTRREGVKIPAVDEQSRADGSRYGGIRVFHAAEADTVAVTKPKYRSINLKLGKLLGITYASDELMQDAPALGAFLARAFPREAKFVLENDIVTGSGVGRALGILNSRALITITPQSPQSSSVLQTQDILNMFARLPAASIPNAVWLVNQDLLPALFSLTLASGSAPSVLLYAPPNNARPAEPGSAGFLLGIPIIPVEYCSAVGTVGDIILCDLNEYLVGTASDVPEFISSIDVKFLTDELAFKLRWRVDGQPAWTSPVTPLNGTNTVSPFVTLGGR